MNAVDVRHLRYFVGVAEELHFGRAAVRLAITQPALSQQIAALEAILGAQLLIRDRRNVVLTPAGDAFLSGARALLGQLDELVVRTRSVAQREEIAISIAMVEYTDLPFVGPALAELRRHYPGIRIDRREMVSTHQIKALLAGQIDVGVGVVLGHEDVTAGIKAEHLVEGNWLIEMPADHRFASASRLAPVDLAGEPLIIFARSVNPPLYDAVRARFREAGVEPHFVYETTQAHIGLRMVGEGAGLMIGADYVLKAPGHGRVQVPLDFMPALSVMIFRRADESSGLVHDLVELLSEKAGEHGHKI